MARKAMASNLKLAYSAKSEIGQPIAYVFSNPAEQGYMILSANDVALPVLGYSDTEVFDENNVPEPLQWWLSEMGRRMEFVESKGLKNESDGVYAPADWTPIAPLCKTKWDQTSPYNQLTPTVDNVQSPTGCVATSFAQVMKYFNYPERGNGIISYQWGTKKLRMNLEATAFQWDKMLDAYSSGYTEEQAKAVSTLMKACGYGVEMNYGKYSSGAQSYKLINALINYFSYDPAATYEDRNLMSYVEWTTKIYENLKNLGPIIYDGTSIDGGHSFVCDGYDGNGYFHFNWGWGGVSDGYYTLDVLNPDAQGTGGSLGGFNFDQNIVLGIQKPTGNPAPVVYANLTQWGNVDASMDGNVLLWALKDNSIPGWVNQSGRSISVRVYACFEPNGGGEKVYVPFYFIRQQGGELRDNLFNLGMNYYFKYPDVTPAVEIPETLADGDYTVTFVVKDEEIEDAPYLPIQTFYGFYNYCYLNINGGNYSVTNVGPESLTFEEMGFNGKVFYGKNSMLTGLVKNTTDLDLSACVQPALVRNGKVQYIADNFLVSLPAQSEQESNWIIQFYQAPGADDSGIGQEYTLQLQNRNTGEVIGTYGEVTLEYTPGALKLQVNDFSIQDSESVVDFTIGSKNFKNVYVAPTRNDVGIVLDYSVTGGFFDCALHMGVQWYDKESGRYITLMEDIYKDYPFLSNGDQESVKVSVDFSQYPGDSVYQVRAYYVQSGQNKSLANMLFSFSPTAVEGITAEEIGTPEYFNLQGMKVDNPEKGQTVIRVLNGQSMKIIF